MDELNTEITKIKNHIVLDSDKIALQIKSPRSTNIVMLGAASPFIDIPYKSFEIGIKNIFGSKGENVVQLNLDALKAGREYAEAHIPVGSN
jgi:indolepyruvate ferredoxin oxidoreductase beta subunit